MLACHNIQGELMAAVKTAGSRFPILFIPRETHLLPEKLREYLQNTINSIENVDYILLPMGRCGNGTLGLVSKKASLVLPKCNDCIDLLLSADRLDKQRPPYTYFLTDGWLGSPGSIDTDYWYAINKYGKETGESIMRMIYNNYKYFTLINTRAYDMDETAKKIVPLAEMTGMTINRLDGPCGGLLKLAKLEIDADFAVIPPGEPVGEKHFI
jgi:hypothetical protein